MAPEQIESGHSDARSDVYAIGLVLYEALSGRIPFDGATSMAVAYRRVIEPPLPIEEVCTVPPTLAEVVMHALAQDATDRWQDATAMREALAALTP